MNLHIEDNNEINMSVNQPESIGMMAGDTINIAVTDYERLDNKPSIEGVELVGELTLEDLRAYTRSQVDALLAYKASLSDIPTKTSQLQNDSGFLTGFTETDPTVPAWAKTPSKPTYTASEVGALPSSTVIPSKTSDLNNDSGFITSETDPTVPSWAKQPSKPTYTATEVGALPSSTQIPTKVSDLDNDSGFITGYTETDPTVPSWAKQASKPSYTAAEVGALPSTTPIPPKGTIFFGAVDGTSTSTVFTATIDGVTEYHDGLAVMLKNGVVTSASGFTININNLGAKPIYNNMAAASLETTIFNINYTMLFVYDSTRVEGGCWICYRGYNSDNNTIGYQLRTNSRLKAASDKFVRYRLLFTSADGNKWVPSNTSTSTSSTAAKTANTRAIDPFGEIVYYSSTTAVNADATPGAGTQWQQYAFNLGYSFYPSGAGMTANKPVYLKCTPNSNGSATMNSIVQALPSTADGFIYIYLGTAYSATNIELVSYHPVYWYKDGGIRLYTNASAASIGAESEYTISDSIVADMGTIRDYGSIFDPNSTAYDMMTNIASQDETSLGYLMDTYSAMFSELVSYVASL